MERPLWLSLADAKLMSGGGSLRASMVLAQLPAQEKGARKLVRHLYAGVEGNKASIMLPTNGLTAPAGMDSTLVREILPPYPLWMAIVPILYGFDFGFLRILVHNFV